MVPAFAHSWANSLYVGGPATVNNNSKYEMS